ncbi:hypothetical protein H9P43_009737 [Blastocladiella emersonii ATCC 22665]|nr:hypothetical protein H9P43_009737 [Blastocladiella emersonii ATCC 22665]
MGNDDEGDCEIMPVGIAQEAHNNDAFLHKIMSIMLRSDQHVAELLTSAVNYGLLSDLNATVPVLPLEPRQQLLTVDSELAWFAQIANYADLARKADEDARRFAAERSAEPPHARLVQADSGVAPPAVRVQLARQEQLAPYLQGLNVEERRVVEHVESTLNAIKRGNADAKLEASISMVGAELFAAMHLRFDALYPSRDHRPFGGLHVLAFGDFSQFEPVMARSLTVPSEQPVERAPEPEVDAAHDGDSMQVDGEPQQQQQQKKRASKRKERPAVSRTRTDANIGRDQWLAFDLVFFLVQHIRQSGDASFLNVLQDLRNCIVSQRVIECLGSRRADVVLGQHPGQLDDWSDQVLITAQNLVRDAWNSMAAAKHARRLGLQPDEIFDLECVDLVRKPSTTGPLLWRQLVIESSGQSESDQRMLNFYPDRLDKTVLLSPIGLQGFTASGGFRGASLGQCLQTELLHRAWNITPQRLLSLAGETRARAVMSRVRSRVANVFGTNSVPPETLVEYLLAGVQRSPGRSGEAAFTALMSPFRGWTLPLDAQLREAIAGGKFPPLVLAYGVADWIDPRYAVHTLAPAVPHGRAHAYLLDGAGHHGYVEAAHEFHQVVLRGELGSSGCAVREAKDDPNKVAVMEAARSPSFMSIA